MQTFYILLGTRSVTKYLQTNNQNKLFAWFISQ